MYHSIIPFSHSIRSTPLTYVGGDIFSGEILPGSIVEIPLGKNLEYGLVVGEAPEPSFSMTDIRSVERIITKRTVIEPYQIDMICTIAHRYMLPIHRVLGFFLTRPIIRRLEKYGFDILSESTQEKNINTENSIVFFSESIVTPHLLETYLREKSVVICPDELSLEHYKKILSSEQRYFLSSESTDTTKAKAWIDIKNGKYNQIFGTRRLLYYNLGKYQHIIYLEDAFGREYFHYPTRIHYLDVLLALEKSKHFSIEILTSVPLLSTLSRCKHFTLKNQP